MNLFKSEREYLRDSDPDPIALWNLIDFHRDVDPLRSGKLPTKDLPHHYEVLWPKPTEDEFFAQEDNRYTFTVEAEPVVLCEAKAIILAHTYK